MSIELTKHDPKMINWWVDTYVFNSWNENEQEYFQCLGHTNTIFEDVFNCYQNDCDFQTLSYFNKLQVVELFHYPNYTLKDGEIFEKQKTLYLDLFSNVFQLTGQNSWNFKHYRIILPKKELLFIDNIIEKYNLTEIRDLILAIIAVAQEFYVCKLFWASEQDYLMGGNNIRKKQKQKLDTYKKVMKHDLDIVAKVIDTYSSSEKVMLKKPKPKITLSFNIKGVPHKITDQFIVYQLIERLKKSFASDCSDKDWKRALTFLNVAENFRKDADFNEIFANALYDLIISGKFKLNKITLTKYRIMEFIVDMFDCCLIPIGSFKIREKDNKHMTEKKRIKTISHYFKNHSKPL